MPRMLSVPHIETQKGVKAIWEIPVPWKVPGPYGMERPIDFIQLSLFDNGDVMLSARDVVGSRGVTPSGMQVPHYRESHLVFDHADLVKLRDDLDELLLMEGISRDDRTGIPTTIDNDERKPRLPD